MEKKYNYLESIAPLILSHGMIKKGNVISCEFLHLLNYLKEFQFVKYFQYVIENI